MCELKVCMMNNWSSTCKTLGSWTCTDVSVDLTVRSQGTGMRSDILYSFLVVLHVNW